MAEKRQKFPKENYEDTRYLPIYSQTNILLIYKFKGTANDTLLEYRLALGYTVLPVRILYLTFYIFLILVFD